MVPGICPKRGTMGLRAFLEYNSIGNLFPQNNNPQYDQGPRLGHLMGRTDVPNTFIIDYRSGGDQKSDDQKGDQRFNFPVTIRVVLVRRSFGIGKSEQYQKGGKYVRGGLNGIGNEGIGVAKKTCQPFYQGQTSVSYD